MVLTMNTEALYFHDTFLFQSHARVSSLIRNETGTAIVLDRTIFYPQGGGQPTDTGTISSDTAEFQVSKALYREDGAIAHYGTFLKGGMETGDEVTLSIDEHRRLLNAKNHTAGHLLTFAAEKIFPELIGMKGYHFPDGPYVEFEGTLAETKKAGAAGYIEQAVRKMIEQALPIEVRLVNAGELARLCRNILPNTPRSDSVRAMIVGGAALACGGTHLANTKEVGSFSIRKIKEEKGRTKIGYT